MGSKNDAFHKPHWMDWQEELGSINIGGYESKEMRYKSKLRHENPCKSASSK